MSAWDDITNALKTAGGAIGSAETYINPSDKQSQQTTNFLSQQGENLAGSLGVHIGKNSNQDPNAPGVHINPNGSFGDWLSNLFSSGGGGKKAARPAATTAAPAQTTNTGNVDDVLNMGLGMFMNQYMAPYMQALSQQNNQTISNWGNTMQQMNTSALPPNVRQLINATYPMQGQLLSMLNQSTANQTAQAPAFNQFLTQLGGLTTGEQALQQAFAHAATASDLNLGNQTQLSSALQQALNQYGGNNNQASILAALLAGGSASTSLPQLPSAIQQAATPTTGSTVTGG